MKMTNREYDALAENCSYDVVEIIARIEGGHRLSAGMAAEVTAAKKKIAEKNKNITEDHKTWVPRN